MNTPPVAPLTSASPRARWHPLLTAVAAASLLAGCAGTKEGSDEKTAQTPSLNITEITQVTQISSTMFDKKCEIPVAPFALTDNFASLTVLAGKLAASNVIEQIGNKTQAQSRHKIPQLVRLAARQMNWLPMAAEKAYGDYLFEQETDILPPDSKLGKKAYPTARKILEDVLSGIPETSEYQFQIHVLKQAGSNAKATPGGHIYVDQGLVTSPALRGKAYFAVAHEISHVLQRHETRALQGQVIDAVSLVSNLPGLLSTMNASRSDPRAIIGILSAGKEMLSRYHADQEIQADACAVRLLTDIFPDKHQLSASITQFISTLPKATTEQAGKKPDDWSVLSEFVSRPIDRHPNTAERIAHLDEVQFEISRKPKNGRKKH